MCRCRVCLLLVAAAHCVSVRMPSSLHSHGPFSIAGQRRGAMLAHTNIEYGEKDMTVGDGPLSLASSLARLTAESTRTHIKRYPFEIVYGFIPGGFRFFSSLVTKHTLWRFDWQKPSDVMSSARIFPRNRCHIRICN